MNKLIFLLILACQIAVITPVSAEEIRLTTIVPDQTVLRAKKGAIGETYSNPATISNGSIPTSSLLVESNMVLAPTSEPSPPQPGMIYFNASDATMYYYRSAALGWAPLSGGGGGAFGLTTQTDEDILSKASTDCLVWAYTPSDMLSRGGQVILPVPVVPVLYSW